MRYNGTTFLQVVGDENDSLKQYVKELRARTSPFFAAYSHSKLVRTWTGADERKFVKFLELLLPSARKRVNNEAYKNPEGIVYM
eukprot:UN2516